MTRRLASAVLLALATAVVVSGCSGASVADGRSKATGRSEQTTATIDLYSGRPNPELTLDATQLAQLSSAIDTLEKSTDAVSTDAGLGFRGVEVAHLTTRYGAATSARVLARTVTLDLDGGPMALADPDSTALKVIVDAADGQVDASVLAALRDELP